MTRHGVRLIALVGAMTLVAGCSSATPSPSASPEGGASATAEGSAGAAPPEVSELTVGTLPIVDVAPVHIAIAEGLFEAEGLTVTPEVMQGGAAAIPALQGGDPDVAFGAWPSFLIANQQGIELRTIADGVAATEGFTQFLALPDSGLEDNPAGMAGKTIALNTLGNLGELALRSTLAAAGVEYADVTPIEVPFPDMGASLEGGSVDVIWAVEPGVTSNKSSLGVVTVIDSYVGDMESFPVAGYMVTAEFAEQNPNTVAAFTRAIEAAAQMANDDPQVVIDIVQTYTELPAELVEQLTYPEYRGELDPANLQRVYDYMLEFEMGEEGLDVPSLVLTSG